MYRAVPVQYIYLGELVADHFNKGTLDAIGSPGYLGILSLAWLTEAGAMAPARASCDGYPSIASRKFV